MTKPEICPTCGRVTSIDKTDEFWKENHWLKAEGRLELLREVEWSSYAMFSTHVEYGYCPICKASKADGHFPNCRLAKELSDDAS